MGDRQSGSCMCGAVAFTAVPGAHAHVCHCGMCRKFSGGMFLGVDCGDSVDFAAPDAVTVYQSSDWAERIFCKTCGSSIAWRLQDGTMTVVSLQCFENPGEFELESQIYVDEKPGNYALANQTIMMTGEEVMAKFAASATEGNA